VSRLWEGREILGAAVGNGLGLLLMVAAYVQSGDRLTLNDQVAPLNLAVLGIILAGTANSALLVVGRLRVRVKLVRLRVALASRTADAVETDGTAGEVAEVVVIGGPRRYRHLPGCQLVVGKDVQEVSDSLAGEPRACGVCHP
jgi:hypothetical protein